MASYCSFLEREKNEIACKSKAKPLIFCILSFLERACVGKARIPFTFPIFLAIVSNSVLPIFAYKFLSAALMVSLGKMLRCGITTQNWAFILWSFDPLLLNSFPDVHSDLHPHRQRRMLCNVLRLNFSNCQCLNIFVSVIYQ